MTLLYLLETKARRGDREYGVLSSVLMKPAHCVSIVSA